MSLALIGAGISALGGIFGGRARKKAAKKAEAQARADADRMSAEASANYSRAMDETIADQARALDLARQDEARLKAATGYDLVKLRDDAQASGFNPLTVLQATGGAGYDGRGAVMTSPFVGRGEMAARMADGLSNVRANGMGFTASAGQAVASTAGYFGDALAGLGRGVFDIGQANVQRRHEVLMQEALIKGATSSPGAAGGRVSGGRAGGSAPMVGATRATASPLASTIWKGVGNFLKQPWADRETITEPARDTPASITVTDWNGNTVSVPNPDIFEDGPAAWYREYAAPAILGGMQVTNWIGQLPAAQWANAFGNRMATTRTPSGRRNPRAAGAW